MGMLTDFIQGAAKSASGIADNKLKEMTEENLLQKKAAIELEREKRVEEAQMRMHDKLRGEQLDDYGRTRSDKVADTAEQRAYESQKDDKNFEQSKSLTNLQAENANQNAESAFNRNKSWATDPNNPDAIKSQVESKLKQMEFEQKAQVNTLYQQYQSETDPAKKEIIADSIDALTGKRAERLQKVEVQIGKDDLGKPILQDVLYDTKRQKVVDVQGQYDTSHKPPMSEDDIDALAREKVGDEPPIDWGNENEIAFNAEKARLRNGGGMIGTAIKAGSNNVTGLKEADGSDNFRSFNSPADSIAAEVHQIELYATGRSKNTGGKKIDNLADLIETRTPSSDKRNNTAQYIANVAEATGYKPNQKIDLTDPQVLKKVLPEIVRNEQGAKALTPDVMKAIEAIGKPNDRDPLGLRG